MAQPRPTSTAGHGLELPPSAVADMRAHLPAVADETVSAIIAEVPGYAGALRGPMGENIRNAVQLALGGFLSLASGGGGADPRTPTAPAVEGAYQLGRGEARSGRSTEALLRAYRIGARVSWREMSTTAVRSGVDAATLVPFAELVFAYIDELSAASVAGHADELATTGRVRQRLLERLAAHLIDGSSPDTVQAAAERAGWEPPETLTAVLVAESQVRPLLTSLPAATISAVELPGLDDGALLLVPDAHGAARSALLRTLAGRGAVAGPARPWAEVRASYDRALRARALGIEHDTEAALTRLVLHADPRGARRPAGPGAGTAGRPAPRHGREAGRDAALAGCCTRAAATTSPPTLFVHAADRALPDGPAARAVRRPARRPGVRAGAGGGAGRRVSPVRSGRGRSSRARATARRAATG